MRKSYEETCQEKERQRIRKLRAKRPRLGLLDSNGDPIHAHGKIYEKFIKDRNINVISSEVKDGKLIIDYTTRSGNRGRLELYDLGPISL